MRRNTSLFHKNGTGLTSVPVTTLARYIPGWILDGESRQLSPDTMEARRWLTGKFLWFLRQQEHSEVSAVEVRSFLAYCGKGHLDPGGRWGNIHKTKQVRPRTVAAYYGNLRTLFRWLVDEGVIQSSPMETVKPVVARPDQIQPFTRSQVEALLAACRHPRHEASRRRNEAIILLLLDTGMRASELCSLRARDLDLVGGRRVTVLGKGNKRRSLPLDKATAKALWQYLNESKLDREPHEPMFIAERGAKAGSHLSRSGLLQLIERLGKTAGISQDVRCSPHTFRHTFAVEFLRAGGNVFALKELLGHSALAICQRYVALAQADIENQHRQYSPVARLKRR